MANEFVIKKGYKSLDNSEITGSLTTTGDITINGGNLDISSTMSSSPTSIIYLDISGTNVDGGGGSIVFDTSATGGSLTNYNAQIRGVRASGGNGGDSQLEFWTTLVSDQTAPKRRAYFTKTGHFYPGLDSTYNIGSNTERFANIYADNLYGDGSNLTNVTASETDTLDSVTDRGSTTTNSITTGDITIQDATPVLVLKDSNNSGGGAAHARILFSNTGGKAIAIGTTGDDDTSTDLYISSNAGSTYGGYLLLDSAGISDAQADIIIDPKTNFKVFTAATEALTINTSQNATFAGVIHTTKDGGAVAAISTPRIRLRTDGVIDWGATYNAGQLTWDSDYAFVNGLSGKGLKFGTNGSTLALTLDTSQNATFAKDITATNGRLTVTHDSNNVAKIIQSATSMSNATYTFVVDSTSHVSNMSAAGAMKVDVNSGRAFTITGAGNVGIGTDNPGAKLQIKGSNSLNALKITDSGGGDGFKVTSHTTQGTYVQMYDANHVQTISLDARTDSTARHSYFNMGGNFGIGTTSPDTKLQVSGTSAVPSVSGTFQGGIFSIEGSSTVSLDMGTTGASGYYAWMQAHDAGNGVNYNLAINPLGGKVGIGTASPLGRLQVNEYTVASQGNQNVHGELSVFANSGDESLFLGVRNAAYPNRGWAFNPVLLE